MIYSSAILLCYSWPKSTWTTYGEWSKLSAVLLKILDIYSFNNLGKIKKIAATHLYSAVEFRSTYYLVGKDIVAEQHILTITLIAIVLEVEPIYSN